MRSETAFWIKTGTFTWLYKCRLWASKGGLKWPVQIACSQSLYFLFKVCQACVIKKIKNRRRYIDCQRKGVRVGKKNIDSFFSHVLHLFLRAHRCFWKERTGHSSKPHCHTKPFWEKFMAVFVAVSEALKTTLTLLIILFEIIIFERDCKLFCVLRFL